MLSFKDGFLGAVKVNPMMFESLLQNSLEVWDVFFCSWLVRDLKVSVLF